MKWKRPRQVDIYLWMEIEEWRDERLIKVGCISWMLDGTGFYSPSITFEAERGLGLYCFPSFRALSDAQDFVEKLMRMTSEEALRVNGQQWPGVVL